jgi:hypothetical protein
MGPGGRGCSATGVNYVASDPRKGGEAVPNPAHTSNEFSRRPLGGHERVPHLLPGHRALYHLNPAYSRVQRVASHAVYR